MNFTGIRPTRVGEKMAIDRPQPTYPPHPSDRYTRTMNLRDIEARIARLGTLADALGRERSLWRSSSKYWISDYLAGILTAQLGRIIVYRLSMGPAGHAV
jgi:hypothetical protein